MRINIYAEEITSEATIARKQVEGVEFYGVRLFLKTPKELHYNTSDDDRTAITLWIPYTKQTGNNPQVVIDALRNMLRVLLKEATFRQNSFIFQEDHIFKGEPIVE